MKNTDLIEQIHVSRSNTIDRTRKFDENFIITNDELKVKLIIMNLVSNAIKFTEKGYVKIIATLVKNFNYIGKKKVNLIKFDIVDSGKGI